MKKVIKSLLLFFFISLVLSVVAVFIYAANFNKTRLEWLQEQEMYFYNNAAIYVTCGLMETVLPYAEFTTYEEYVYKPELKDVIFEMPEYYITIIPNEEAIRAHLQELYEPARDAYIDYSSEDGYSLRIEYDEMSFDVDMLTTEVVKSMTERKNTLSYFDAHIYPEVFSTDLVEKYVELSWINDFRITYYDGPTLTALDLAVSDAKEWELDEKALEDFGNILQSLYTDNGTTIDFKTSSGDTVPVKYMTYGESIDVEKELEFIRESLESHKSTDNYSPKIYGYTGGYETGNYIEVSLENQHVWHYTNGELCCETDCVTGTKGVHDTPTGAYYVSERIPGKYLTGPTWNRWVDRWMRLTDDGIGLHDAVWRSTFGGVIFTYNGSHGCINLPKDYAYRLFDEIKNGYLTIIY